MKEHFYHGKYFVHALVRNKKTKQNNKQNVDTEREREREREEGWDLELVGVHRRHANAECITFQLCLTTFRHTYER